MNALSKNISLTGLLAAAGLTLATAANAVPVLELEFSNNLGADESAVVIDNGANDANGLVNVVQANNLLTSLDVDIAVGSIFGDPGAQFSVVVADFGGSPTDGTLSVTLADTGFTGGSIITFVSDFVANSGFNAMASLSVTTSNCNVVLDGACASTEIFSGPANSLNFAPFDLTGVTTYGIALTQTFEIDRNGAFGFSGDYTLSVAEPTTLALLGLGALAFGAGARRRRS